MLASPLPQDDHFSLSYVRQPGEEAEVLCEAHRRFGLPLVARSGMTSWYLMIGIVGGAALSLFLNIYRSLILLPAFGPTPLIDVSNLILICFFPCLMVYVLMTLYVRRENHLQRTAMATRIRPDATVTVTISPQAIVWERSGATLQLAWAAICDIGERDGRIEFDSDATVHYIPAHAFHNQQEQAAFLERVRGLWQPLDPAKP
jgi:uncharacterized membrane protein (DUF485 family)